MDRLLSMRVFREVADLGSFTKAAQQLDLSGPVVTRLVANLEAHLGTRLLNRSTRSLSLTETGDAYLERCRRILDEVDETDAWIMDQSGTLSGELRIVSPVSLGIGLLTPLLAGFYREYPQISIDLVLTDKPVDMVAEHFDLAIMVDQPGVGEGLVARKLLQTKGILCASPDYIAKHGLPLQPQDIQAHACLNFAHPQTRYGWELHEDGGGCVRAKVNNVMVCNNVDALAHAARAGMGICPAFACLVAADLQRGELVRVLPKHTLAGVGYQLVYPSRKYLPAKVRSMIEYLLSTVGIAAWPPC